MADYRVTPPEVTPSQINPMIGAYQDGYGRALSGLGSDINRTFSGMASRAADTAATQGDKDQKISLAQYAIASIDLKMDQATEALSGFIGMDLTESEARELQSSAMDTQRLRQVELQRPGQAMNSLRQAALLREHIARAPLVAQELMAMHKGSVGKGVGETLQDIVTQTENPRAAFIEDITTTFRNMGGDPLNTSLEEQARQVSKVRQLATNKQISDNEFALRDNKDRHSQRDSLTSMRVNDAPYYAQMLSVAMNTSLAEINYDMENATPEWRALKAQNIDQMVAETRAALQAKYPNPLLSSADYDSALAPVLAQANIAKELLSGKITAEQAKRQVEILSDLAQSRFYQDNPEMLQAETFWNTFKGLDGSFADAFGATRIATELQSVIMGASARVADQIQYTAALNQAKRGGPEAMQEVMEIQKWTLRDLARNPDISNEEISNQLITQFGSYEPGSVTAELFNGTLTELASPEVLARIKSTASPQARAALQASAGAYLEDLSGAIRNKAQQMLGSPVLNPRIQQLPDLTREEGKPMPPGSRMQISFLDTVAPYIERTVATDGTITFRSKGSEDSTLNRKSGQLAHQMNAISPKLKAVVDLYDALGVTQGRSKAEVADMILRGEDPTRALVSSFETD